MTISSPDPAVQRRSLVDCQRRFKMTNTNFGSYNVICICETWLNPGIPDSELLLNDHTIYRSDREHRNINLHGRSLIAEKNFLGSENFKMDVECCTIGKIRFISDEICICSFYYPPKNSQHMYDVDCYHRILEAIPKNRKAVICGDLSFPSTNWGAYWSTDKEEQDVLNILEERLLRKTLDLPTCGKNILDVLLYQNCELFSEIDNSFKALYDCSDRLPVVWSLEIDYQQEQRTKERYYSFTKADFDSMLCHRSSNPLQPLCFSNANNMYNELQDYAMTLIDNLVPRRTRFRQSLPPWIAAATSNNMKRLNTQRIKLATRPTTYKNNKVRAREAEVLENCEADRIAYQERVFGTRNTNEIFRHLKYINKAPRIPKTVE